MTEQYRIDYGNRIRRTKGVVGGRQYKTCSENAERRESKHGFPISTKICLKDSNI